MRAIYVADSEGVVAVAANTTKTVFGIKGNSGIGVDLLLLGFSVDQATPTATDKAIYIEFGYCTFATNAPGTNSSTVTVDQRSGRVVSASHVAGKNWTTEPTVITPLDPFDVDPYKFTANLPEPLMQEADTAAAEGFVLRVTNPTGNQSVNVRAWARFARV